MGTAKIKMKLDEPNDLRFNLSIKGSVSDPSTAQPKIRFLINDEKSNMSICFPMDRKEDGTIGVVIPGSSQFFQENIEYTGSVEVIVGSRWFNPTTVGLVFEREMVVEVSAIINNSIETNTSEVDEISCVIKPEAILEKIQSDPRPVEKKAVMFKRPVTLDASTLEMKTDLKKLISSAYDELEIG